MQVGLFIIKFKRLSLCALPNLTTWPLPQQRRFSQYW